MKIKNKEYRIKENVYKDGHKVYTAQVATNFYFFKIWNDFIYRSDKIKKWAMKLVKTRKNQIVVVEILELEWEQQ